MDSRYGQPGQPEGMEIKGDAGHPDVQNWAEKAASGRLRKERFETMSGLPLKDLYLPEEVDDKYMEEVGLPGVYPFTRGPYPSMHRGRLWTMRMFAGFGTPEDTNKRFKYLLSQGQTGLSTAFDMPALMGYDADHSLSRGEVGREGVSVSSIDDMRRLFEGIPLGEVTTSMTINGPAIVALAMYVAVAEEQGVPRDKIGGTLQNDILKEFIAQKEWISPLDRACESSRTCWCFAAGSCRGGTPSASAAITSVRLERLRSRNWHLPSPTGLATSKPGSMRVLMWTSLPPIEFLLRCPQ